jgi:uncharacterized membrane protein YeaQ/YmgE (transglycosylase-associated protein family)
MRVLLALNGVERESSVAKDLSSSCADRRLCNLSKMAFPQGGAMTATLFGLLLDTRIIVVEFRHRYIYWLLVGLIAGWLAGKIARGRGFGCFTDIVLGLVGAYLGGWVFGKLGILGGGFLYSLAAATLGAVILVSIAHLFSSHG